LWLQILAPSASLRIGCVYGKVVNHFCLPTGGLLALA
jgi:hypothetical protein